MMNLTWFCFENELVLQYERNDTDYVFFYDSLVISRWNAHVYSTTLICGLGVYVVEAFDLVCLVLIYLFQLF